MVYSEFMRWGIMAASVSMRGKLMDQVKMQRLKFWAAVLLTLSFAVGAAAAQAGVPGGSGSAFRASPPVFERAKKLRRGVNASEWFAQVYDKRGYTPGHFSA